MIMGELCTRRCGFCAVKDGTLENLEELSPSEPARVAEAVRRLGLRHVVVTSVNRDDLPDMGAGHFDATVRAIRAVAPQCQIELLTPDMRGRRPLVESILASGEVAVFNHNFETVPHLYPTVRPGAKVERSLDILKWAKEIQPGVRTKSGVMLGLGETRTQVLEVMDMLRASNCDVLTLGQYLRPSEKQLPVVRFVPPDEFAEFKREGLARGFKHVESGPLVRSSYHAAEHTDAPTPAVPAPLDFSGALLQLGVRAR
jgi:lipoyl synthase